MGGLSVMLVLPCRACCEKEFVNLDAALVRIMERASKCGLGGFRVFSISGKVIMVVSSVCPLWRSGVDVPTRSRLSGLYACFSGEVGRLVRPLRFEGVR